jgi:TonB family protein
MPLALLLSPDDQAVSAITGVLEEMSVTCERPLDGVSAAQLLNSHTFDLVLVDCENLPAAKLIFDVCRRGKNGNNPVPIAIVDGRAGLPTAFRLGAELILTKPVAKDQARTTIRTAVGRVRKDVPAGANAAAHAAAAAAASSPAPVFADPVANFAAPAANAQLSAGVMKMNSAVDVDEHVQHDEAPTPVHSKPVIPLTPSDDPVLAELERTELEESERAQPQAPGAQQATAQTTASGNADSKNESLKPRRAHKEDSAAKSYAPASLEKYASREQKRSPLVAVMLLVIAVGGLYGAWMYEPGFRAIAQPQIDRVLALAGMAAPAHARTTAKPSLQPVPIAAPTPTPAPVTATDSTSAQSTSPDSATDSASVPPAGSTAPSTLGKPTPAPSTAPAIPVQTASPGAAVAPAASGIATTGVPSVSKPNDAKNDTKKDAAKDTTLATPSSAPSSTPLPGENTAVILSSQGAQKRLLTSVPPQYPAAARTEGAEGTVVLKAVIDETGKVGGLRLVEGNATLAPAAMKAVKQWRYRPYIRDGKAQPFQTIVIVDFQQQ